MPMALYCTAEEILSLDLATGRALRVMLHVARLPGTAQHVVRVHGHARLQAARASHNLAGSLMEIFSLLQPHIL